jgi:lantibiotic modifying enzyme
LGPKGYLNGKENLLKLFNEYPQVKDLIETKLCQATNIMSFLNEFKDIIVIKQKMDKLCCEFKC